MVRIGVGSAMLIAACSLIAACGRQEASGSPPPTAQAPASLKMGGSKSRMTFFVTSTGLGRGGDLGGLAGADAHCQALATAEGAGDHTWRAYLSTAAAGGQLAVNARDRIGPGPWYDANAELIASSVAELHSASNRISFDTALTERGDPVNGASDSPVTHDILTGSKSDGTAYTEADDLTCRNWTSDTAGHAQLGHHDRRGGGADPSSWNSAHVSRGCSLKDLQSTGGAGLFYCFGTD